MHLRDFFDPTAFALPLQAPTAGELLQELVALLRLEPKASATLVRVLERREELGSTGVGRGVAIPHGRTLAVSRLRVAYGFHPGGIPWKAVDDRPAHHFFMIVAPPIEVSNHYLPVLGRVATLVKEPDVPHRLAQVRSPEEFFRLLEEKGV